MGTFPVSVHGVESETDKCFLWHSEMQHLVGPIYLYVCLQLSFFPLFNDALYMVSETKLTFLSYIGHIRHRPVMLSATSVIKVFLWKQLNENSL